MKHVKDPASSLSFTKQLNEHLSISLRYGDGDGDCAGAGKTSYNTNNNNTTNNNNNNNGYSAQQLTRTCILTITNIANNKIIVNPENGLSKSEKSHYSNNLNGTNGSRSSNGESKEMLSHESSGKIVLFLGHIQLFGYVVLNYRFTQDSSSLDMHRPQHWWKNGTYLGDYVDTREGTRANNGEEGDNDEEEEEEEMDRELKVESTPFIYDHLHTKKLLVGGKLGGVGDLVADVPEHATTGKAHFLHDLISNFDTSPPLPDKPPLDELVESIVPFYATPQSLLFTDLVLEKGESKKYEFQVPVDTRLPPTYNARLTGIPQDQGWTSVRYSLIISLSEGSMMDEPKSVYFPMYIKPFKHPTISSLQRLYYENLFGLDKEWKILDVTKYSKEVTPDDIAKSDFMLDLETLIDSDLYNMPKISTSERRRRRSSGNLLLLGNTSAGTGSGAGSGAGAIAIGDNDYEYVTQLPSQLRTLYQLRANNEDLCKVLISKPYYNLGDDIHFVIDINMGNENKIIGLNGYIEAMETYHAGEGGKKNVENVYKVTNNLKVNLLASAITHRLSRTPSLVSDYINIPKFLTPQFQSRKFMDLKYHLTFQFNFAQLSIDSQISTTLLNSQSALQNPLNEFVPRDALKGELVGNSCTFRVPLYVVN